MTLRSPYVPGDRTVWVILAATVLGGAALRLYGLDAQSLWNDELSGWAQFSVDSWWRVLARVPVDHTPAFWWLLHGWMQVAGDSEIALRLPSALLGSAAVAAMFALGRTLYGQREGLIAAAVTATAWMPIFYSQEARPYMLLLLLVVLVSIALIDVVRGLQRTATLPRVAALAYVIAAALTCYTHYFGLLFICLQAALVGMIILRRQPHALVRIAALYTLVFASFVPWLRRAEVVVAYAPDWIAPVTPRVIWDLQRFLFNDSTPFAVLALGLWATLLVREYRTRRQPRAARLEPPTLLLLVWLVVPVAVVYVRSMLAAPAFINRVLIIVAPAAYLLVARAIAQLSVRRWVAPLATGALCAALLVDLFVVRRYYREPTKEQFREAAAYLVAHDQAAAPTVVLACAHNRKYFDYYLERLGSPRRVDAVAVAVEDDARVQELIAARAPVDVWLLAGHLTPPPEILASLSKRLHLVDEAQFVHAGVWHFRP
ncbi:MAG: glycosyltransferase family 39 protein [bacterium]